VKFIEKCEQKFAKSNNGICGCEERSRKNVEEHKNETLILQRHVSN